MPILTWYGHSCFGLDLGAGGSVIFDPYSPESVPGAELPKGLAADLVLCSHQHGDHNAADRVKLGGRKPAFTLKLLDSFHDPDRGKKRGPNKIALVEYEGFRAVHLGDLGCPLTQEQIDVLKEPDLLLIPVGGFFTIGPEEAVKVLEQLRPRAAVPMHYRRGEMGFSVLSPLEDFTGRCPGWKEWKSSVLEIGPDTAGVYVMSL